MRPASAPAPGSAECRGAPSVPSGLATANSQAVTATKGSRRTRGCRGSSSTPAASVRERQRGRARGQPAPHGTGTLQGRRAHLRLAGFTGRASLRARALLSVLNSGPNFCKLCRSCHPRAAGKGQGRAQRHPQRPPQRESGAERHRCGNGRAAPPGSAPSPRTSTQHGRRPAGLRGEPAWPRGTSGPPARTAFNPAARRAAPAPRLHPKGAPSPPGPNGTPPLTRAGRFLSLSLSLCGPEPPPAAVPTPVPPPADAAPLSLPAPPLTATAPAPPAPRYAPRAAPDRIENQSGAMNAVSAPGRGWDPGSPSCGRPACGSARGWVSFEVPPNFSHSLMCRAARTLLCKRRGWFVHGQLSDRPWDPSLLHLASPALGMKGG